MVSFVTLNPLLRLFSQPGIPRRILQTFLRQHGNLQFSTVQLIKKRVFLEGSVLENSRRIRRGGIVISNRHGSTSVKSQGDTSLVIQSGDRDLEIPYIWLRDHCRCHTCYNNMTSQKNVDSYTLSCDIAPKNVQTTEDGKEIQIEWPDGHRSQYHVDWLVEHSFSTVSKVKTAFHLWDKAAMMSEPLPVVQYDAYSDDSQDGMRDTFRNLLKYGFSILEGVEASMKGTKLAAERLSLIQETIFGRMWSLTSDLKHSDMAYTNMALGPHTDTTYLYQPAGIQVFHCIWHDGTGGKTLLVDGFHAAEQLRRDHPEDFDFLSRAVVPHEYKEWDENHLVCHGNVLRVHPASGELMHIRFNPYDMAPLDTIPPHQIAQFYSAYSRLASYLRAPAATFWLKLHPGMVLLTNNWRILHGRSSFTGGRAVCGCYLTRDDWMNRVRMYGLV